MKRILLALICIGLLSCRGDDATPTNSSCCKRCTTGKPCGDSCIESSKTCNKGAGCACSG